LIERTQRIAVTAQIQTRWSTIVHESAASVNIRKIATIWVSGRTVRATYPKTGGRSASGKKVPAKSDIGVMNRKEG
jgi:hypothetical protein